MSTKIIRKSHKGRTDSQIRFVEEEVITSAPIQPMDDNGSMIIKPTTTIDKVRSFMRQAAPRRPIFCLLGTLCLLIVIAGIAALVIYFVLWKGMPTVNFVGIEKPKDLASSNTQFDLGEPGVRSPAMKMSVFSNIEINNPNLMNLAFEDIRILGYSSVLPDVAIATTNIASLDLPKDSKTALRFPLNLAYNFGSDSTQAFPKELTEACTIRAGQTAPAKQLTLNLKINLNVKITNEIKVAIPEITTTQSFDCPFAGSNVAKIGNMEISFSKIDWVAFSQGQFSFVQ